MDKRIVLEHTQGLHPGLLMIIGTEPQLRLGGIPLPEFIPRVDFVDHKGAASLSTIKRSYVLYKEQ